MADPRGAKVPAHYHIKAPQRCRNGVRDQPDPNSAVAN
jgi:hypothetical protein